MLNGMSEVFQVIMNNVGEEFKKTGLVWTNKNIVKSSEIDLLSSWFPKLFCTITYNVFRLLLLSLCLSYMGTRLLSPSFSVSHSLLKIIRTLSAVFIAGLQMI